MENHWGHPSLRVRWFLILGIIGLFFLGDVLMSFPDLKEKGKTFSETQTFFKGSDQEVNVYSLYGRGPGPTMLIFAGIHGDESGGYLTADRYVGLKCVKGNLMIVPRLNLYAVLTKKRTGLSGQDMNQKFLPFEEDKDPDDKVAGLGKSLMGRADIILNLHQGRGFYSPVWIDKTRNPIRLGQCNVIDVPILDLPDGRKLELEQFAQGVVEKINFEIGDERYRFHVNNTDTASKESLHPEQRRSLTYYALTGKHKMAFGIEATNHCSLPQAISYLTMAVNAMMERAGIVVEGFPSPSPTVIAGELKRNEKFSGLIVRVNDVERLIPPKGEIFLTRGDRFQILSVKAMHTRGRYPFLSDSHIYNGIGKVFLIKKKDWVLLQKDGKRVAAFIILMKEDNPSKLEAGT
jgi:hypothetical protein